MENTQKMEQQFMKCQTEQQDLATPIKDLTPGTLYRFRFESPWQYFMVLGYGKADRTPQGFPDTTIKFLTPRGKVGEIHLFKFKSVFNNFDKNELEIIQCL